MTRRYPNAGDETHAGVIAPPPLIVLGGFLLGLALDQLGLPRLPRGNAVRGAGAGLSLGGLALALWAFVTFRRGGTPIEPHRPTRRLVTWGPYRYSRNPIYLALTALSAGAGLLLGRLGPLLSLPLVLGVLRQGVVLREERYLARRFDDAYRAYRAQVRRWL